MKKATKSALRRFSHEKFADEVDRYVQKGGSVLGLCFELRQALDTRTNETSIRSWRTGTVPDSNTMLGLAYVLSVSVDALIEEA